MRRERGRGGDVWRRVAAVGTEGPRVTAPNALHCRRSPGWTPPVPVFGAVAAVERSLRLSDSAGFGGRVGWAPDVALLCGSRRWGPYACRLHDHTENVLRISNPVQWGLPPSISALGDSPLIKLTSAFIAFGLRGKGLETSGSFFFVL